MAGWTANIDFTKANLCSSSQILPVIIKAMNERLDACSSRRMFDDRHGVPTTDLSTLDTEITINPTGTWESSLIGYINKRGFLRVTNKLNVNDIAQLTKFDVVEYTDFSIDGSGNYTFTISESLSYNYTLSESIIIMVIGIHEDYLPLGEVYRLSLVDYTMQQYIDLRITELISKYANHTLSIGNEFVNLEDVPPWTEADILEAAHGVPTDRIYAGYLSETSAEWVDQVYKIINLLRWVRNEQAYSGNGPLYNYLQDSVYNYYSRGYAKASGNDSWSVINTNWGSATWGLATHNQNIQNFGSYDIAETYHSVKYYARRVANDFSSFTYLNTVNHEADLYLHTTAPENLNDGGPAANPIFDDEGLGLLENKYNRFISLSSTATMRNLFDVRSILDGLGVPPQPSTTPTQNWRGWCANGLGDAGTPPHIAVLRFDVVGGFEYID